MIVLDILEICTKLPNCTVSLIYCVDYIYNNGIIYLGAPTELQRFIDTK